MGIVWWAAVVGLRTLSAHRTANDVSTALTIFSEINRYWDCLAQPDCDFKYNIGQVLTHFEIASALFNKNVLTETASVILADHMVEVFTTLQVSENGARLIEQCRSAETTFDELRMFAGKRFPQALNTLAFASKNEGQISL